MTNTFFKIFDLIKISNLKGNYYFIFILTFINFLLELISLGSLIPFIAYIIDPELIFNFLESKNYNNKFLTSLFTFDREHLTKILFLGLLIIFFVKTLYGLFYAWYLNTFAIKFERNLTNRCLSKYYDNFDLYFSKIKKIYLLV